MVPISDLTINGEHITMVGPVAVLPSKSAPGTVHAVYNGRCDCLGFQYRQRCRHLTVVTELKAAVTGEPTNVGPSPTQEAERRQQAIAKFNADCWG